MKKIILILTAAAFFGTYTATAQEIASTTKTEVKKTKKIKKAKKVKAAAEPVVQGPSMKFSNETIDYGTLKRNENGERAFEFINNGNQPLIITNATGSCGCTVPTFPKEPIMPGSKAVIGVKYDTNRIGAFTKTVTITTNSTTEPSKVLTIKGTIVADPQATPATETPKS